MTGFRDQVNASCAPLPGAECSDPWGGGHDAWKVGGKMFACIGAVDPGVSVKTADVETAAMLIDAGLAAKAPYFHGSWVRFAYDRTDAEEVLHRLDQPHDLIRASLKNSERDALPQREST